MNNRFVIKIHVLFIVYFLSIAISSSQVVASWTKLTTKPYVLEVPSRVLFSDSSIYSIDTNVLSGLYSLLRDSSNYCIEITADRTLSNKENIKRLQRIIEIRKYICRGIDYKRAIVRLIEYNKKFFDDKIRFALLKKL